MTYLLVNAPSTLGTRLVRSYSGGYGDVLDPDQAGTIFFPPLELLRLGTILRAAGKDTLILDWQAQETQLPAARPDGLVVTLSLPTLVEDSSFARNLRHRTQAERLIIVTSLTDPDITRTILEKSGADLLVSPRNLADAAEFLLGSAQPSHLALPIDRSLLDHSPYRFEPLRRLDSKAETITTMNAGYGCPYPCGYYCPYPAAEGSKFSAVSLDRLLAEFAQVESLGIGGVVFRDPVFSMDMNRTRDFCSELLLAGLSIPWWCETRLDRLTPELLHHMRKANCRGIEIGIESGEASSQQRNTRKNLDLDRVVAIRDQARELGIHIEFLFVIGLVGDGRENIVGTLEFIDRLDLRPEEFNLSTITAYPGTAFYKEANEKGWLAFKHDQLTGYDVNVRTDRLDFEELQFATALGARLRSALSNNRPVNKIMDEARDWMRSA
ncbi:radical SAM protein [Parerythrobacter aestuarii]|uniref:radical SAM protein n=1 Tax=Parerythrobacter aestuarii TaxID=3020909 RepID=UPI0024DEF938|nr:radical SAM protein [Parerythrobacter aestuarii]